MRIKEELEKLNQVRSRNFNPLIKYGEEVHKLPPANQPILYTCPTCGKGYSTIREAEECRDTPFDTAGLKIGDILIIPGVYCYKPPAEGFEHWCAFEIDCEPTAKSHFDRRKRFYPYYVVTAIHGDQRRPHRCLVTVTTLFSGKISASWNPANGDGHYSMFHVGVDCQSDDYAWNYIRQGEKIGKRIASANPCGSLKADAKELSDLGISTKSDLL